MPDVCECCSAWGPHLLQLLIDRHSRWPRILFSAGKNVWTLKGIDRACVTLCVTLCVELTLLLGTTSGPVACSSTGVFSPTGPTLSSANRSSPTALSISASISASSRLAEVRRLSIWHLRCGDQSCSGVHGIFISYRIRSVSMSSCFAPSLLIAASSSAHCRWRTAGCRLQSFARLETGSLRIWIGILVLVQFVVARLVVGMYNLHSVFSTVFTTLSARRGENLSLESRSTWLRVMQGLREGLPFATVSRDSKVLRVIFVAVVDKLQSSASGCMTSGRGILEPLKRKLHFVSLRVSMWYRVVLANIVGRSHVTWPALLSRTSPVFLCSFHRRRA